jgi:succinate-semialdehyde dehydrogenase/glutarate-semialdehyde dehydrogenase
VQEQSYPKFLARFTEYAKNVKMGDGLEKGTTMGPLANPRRLDAMEALVNDSKSRGATIVTFKSFDEVVERANSLEYGLAAYAFTTSSSTAAAIGDALESGMVGVNSVAISTPETPFGGVKESGHGSEGGIEGLGAYLVTKFISQG